MTTVRADRSFPRRVATIGRRDRRDVAIGSLDGRADPREFNLQATTSMLFTLRFKMTTQPVPCRAKRNPAEAVSGEFMP